MSTVSAILAQLNAVPKDQIKDIKVQDCEYHVRLISAKDALEFSAFQETKPTPLATMIRLVQSCLCDELGNPVFKSDEEAVVLETVPFKILNQLYTAAADHNRLNSAAGEALEGN